jgi:hypothetical protein
MAITSKEINLSQLSKELGDKGLIGDFNDPKKKLILPAQGVELTEDELKNAIDVHVAKPVPELTVEEKLSSVGLSLHDLKTALGL